MTKAEMIRIRRAGGAPWFRKGEPWTLGEDRALLRYHTALVIAGVDGHEIWFKVARKHARTYLGVEGRYRILTAMIQRVRELTADRRRPPGEPPGLSA